MKNKTYYLFVGQNATTGQPNKITGYYSFYGRIYAFSSKSERDTVYSHLDGRSAQDKIVKGGRTKMRSLCLGLSMLDFNSYLDSLDYSTTSDFRGLI
jgi:hypothetical protein